MATAMTTFNFNYAVQPKLDGLVQVLVIGKGFSGDGSVGHALEDNIFYCQGYIPE